MRDSAGSESVSWEYHTELCGGNAARASQGFAFVHRASLRHLWMEWRLDIVHLLTKYLLMVS